MKNLLRSQLVPSLVKEVELTTAYPGYRFTYFKSFKELDEYFTQECGFDWKEQEWALFWLRDYWRSVKQDARELREPSRVGTVNNTKPPTHIIKALIEHYQLEQRMSLRQIAQALQTNDSVALTYSAISKFMKRHSLPTE